MLNKILNLMKKKGLLFTKPIFIYVGFIPALNPPPECNVQILFFYFDHIIKITKEGPRLDTVI